MNILLIHGMFDRGSIFRRLESDLTQSGHRCFSPSLRPNDARDGIADLAEKLASLVDEVFYYEEPLVIIGFSMGCLIARYYLHYFHATGRTKAFFAISGPHHGTWTAYCYPGRGAREMRPGSLLLRDLNAVDHTRMNFPIFTYWTPFDLMIIPSISSQWAPATEYVILSPLHPLMPSNKKVRADICTKIQAL
jgi:triacylglycerol lipase